MRPRKRHIQLSFPRRGRPHKKRAKFWYGQHKLRPRISGREPILITARVSRAAGNLRRRRIYHAVRRALAVAQLRTRFRIVHLSIQRTHLHLLVEAADHAALSRGMQGFLISAARRINAAISPRHRGTVFPDRYHERVVDSPAQCRNALSYVLNNWRHHGDDRDRDWLVDPLSSASNFSGWRELSRRELRFPPLEGAALPTSASETWLLRVGWTRQRAISVLEIPGDD